MPQLDVPRPFAPQLFWLAIWFVVLYVLMSKVGLPRIALAIEARRQRREDDLARAAADQSRGRGGQRGVSADDGGGARRRRRR